jgi:hypothetical protein
VLLGAITLVGILLRLPSFSDSLFGDELSAYFVVTDHGLGDLIDLVQGDQEVTPPLYFLLARLTQGIGNPIDSLRWVPMLCGIACIPLTYHLGMQTVGRRAGLVAAAIMAFSPFSIFYSSEARPYGLLMVLCLGSTLALLQAVRAGARRGWWALYAALSCGVMYTHYTGAFVLVGQAGWALACHRESWRWLLGSNVAAALGWAPWLSSYRADQDSPGADLIGVLQPFGFHAFKTDVLHWAIGAPLTFVSIRDMPGGWAIALIALGLAVGLATLAVELARGRIRLTLLDERLSLILILALSSVVIAGLYSAISVSVFQPRNLIASTPGLALVLAVIVTRPGWRAARVAATALLVAGFAIAGVRMLDGEAHRPDYKGVASFVVDRGGGAGLTVDSVGLFPGPLSSLDVAFAPGVAQPREVALRLGRASQADQLRADRPGGPGQFAPLPIPSPRSIARRAVRRANGRAIFLVSPGSFTFAELRGDAEPGAGAQERARVRYIAKSAAGAFARALPGGYRAVETKVFPGLFGVGSVSAYVLRRANAADRGDRAGPL